MKKLFLIMAAATLAIASYAETYDYRFQSTRLSEALDRIAREHPALNLNFIYNELGNYRTSARIHTPDAYDALRQAIGLNPVSVLRKGDTFYVEALQHGRYIFTGQAMGSDGEPAAGATIMLLAPRDSTVLTYGVADADGRFSIPCDSRQVIAKLSSIGYETTLRRFSTPDLGTIILPLQATDLGEVQVHADNALLTTDKSIFTPTSRQKNASLSGSDLINNMAIPQLGMSGSSGIVTNTGKPVSVFIDYIPASEDDLRAMRIADVRRVEYSEYPSDPRLQGHPYVINFIMQKYEMGGYFKTFANAIAISNARENALANVRLQYKRMTYDMMGSVTEAHNDHNGAETTETFRLPTADGGTEEFKRFSNTTSSRDRKQVYFATLRATYNSPTVQAASYISGSIDRRPHTDRTGTVSFTPAVFPTSAYSSTHNNRSGFIYFKGYYFFALPKGNSLTFNPSYMRSHTVENSLYAEEGYDPIRNGATDNTNQLAADLRFKHDFGRFGNLSAQFKGSYEYNRTRYTGSASALDRARSSRVGLAVNYDITTGPIYGQISFGWDWDRLQFGQTTDRPSAPRFDLSLQYTPSKRHTFSATLEYETWLPLPTFKSDKVIEASPLLSYTGNPNLKPAKSYSADLNYSWVPGNNASLSAFGWVWVVGDRYVYDYEASTSGVLRTIKQPMGIYAQGMYGVKGSVRFLDRSLELTGQIGHLINRNGSPYNVTHHSLHGYGRIGYYVRGWNFRLTYQLGGGSADGSMNGIWHKARSKWYITATWGNDKWNVRADIFNFTRWNYRNATRTMDSPVYSTREILLNGSDRAFVQLAVTYTLGFGKRVQRTDQPVASGSAASGILK